VIVVAGGSLLAWRGLRATTLDVDSVSHLVDELVLAAERVAHRHDLDPTWLNDRAAAFLPQTFDESACDVLHEHPRLLVLGLPFRELFLMKLFAARGRDYADLVSLWSHTGFAAPEEAVEAMYDAYPAAPRDEFLESFVAEIAREGRR
jgi:hypothetical protein